MKCLVLAAGYATRLYPLTKNFPKPLLKVGDKTILDWLLDDIEESKSVDDYIIISNHKFVCHFEDWAKTKLYKISVLDDGTTSNENRLGAVKDLQYAVDQYKINEDVLVIAGDNLLDFSLRHFISYAQEKKTSCIMRYYEPSYEKLVKCGVVTIDVNDKIINMVEKPIKPESNWCCPPFYYYTKDDIKKLQYALDYGCQVDAPGSYVSWLCQRSSVHAMQMPGQRYDIGNIDSYTKIKSIYNGVHYLVKLS